MLIPQYSLRWLLGVTAACAVVFSIVALGAQGISWAAGIATSIVALVILMVIYAAFFAGVWVCSAVLPDIRRTKSGRKSPFQEGATRLSPLHEQEVPATPTILD